MSGSAGSDATRTSATNRYPFFGIVSIYAPLPGAVPSALRSTETFLGEITLLDEAVWPHGCQQFVFRYRLAGPFYQRDQRLEDFRSERHERFTP